MVLDKTPSYYLSQGTPAKIFHYNNKTKLILIVREPFERVLSHLAHFYGVNRPWSEYKDIVIDNVTELIKAQSVTIRVSTYSR